MDRIRFVTLLEPLALALGKEFDKPGWTIYFRALEDVSEPLIAAAVERAAKTCRFMPKPGELREFAAEAEKALKAAHPFECLCGNCSRDGFVPREIDGVIRMVKGSCWKAHQQKLASLGVGSERLALPAPDPDLGA